LRKRPGGLRVCMPCGDTANVAADNLWRMVFAGVATASTWRPSGRRCGCLRAGNARVSARPRGGDEAGLADISPRSQSDGEAELACIAPRRVSCVNVGRLPRRSRATRRRARPSPWPRSTQLSSGALPRNMKLAASPLSRSSRATALRAPVSTRGPARLMASSPS
jgi:hypothetical protein